MSLKDLAKTEKKLNKPKRHFIIGAIISGILLLGLCVAALFAKKTNPKISDLDNTSLHEMYVYADNKVLDMTYYLIQYEMGITTFDETLFHINDTRSLLHIEYLLLRSKEEK